MDFFWGKSNIFYKTGSVERKWRGRNESLKTERRSQISFCGRARQTVSSLVLHMFALLDTEWATSSGPSKLVGRNYHMCVTIIFDKKSDSSRSVLHEIYIFCISIMHFNRRNAKEWSFTDRWWRWMMTMHAVSRQWLAARLLLFVFLFGIPFMTWTSSPISIQGDAWLRRWANTNSHPFILRFRLLNSASNN